MGLGEEFGLFVWLFFVMREFSSFGGEGRCFFGLSWLDYEKIVVVFFYLFYDFEAVYYFCFID